MLKIVLLGPQGCGKGTQGEKISEKYHLAEISMGDLLRHEIHEKTEIGLKIEKIIDDGDLVPDEVTFSLLKNRIKQEDCKRGFILDGFPRDFEQAEFVAKNFDINCVLVFDLSDSEGIKRIGGRRTCEDCGEVYHVDYKKPKVEGVCDECSGKLIIRDDDYPDAIKHRLDIYHQNSKKILDCFSEDVVYHVDANREIDVIFEDVKKILNKITKF